MSDSKKCIFVESRNCPFQTNQVKFSTCQLCIEAWKTEVAFMREQSKGSQPTRGSSRLSLQVIENGVPFLNNRLKEIDEQLKDDDLDPLEYIQLRKNHINSIIGGEPLKPKDLEPKKQPTVKRGFHIVIVTKTLIRKKVKTVPEEWELPKEVSDKVIDTIFDLAKTRNAEDIRLRAGEHKIAGIAVDKNRIALMFFDANEDFEDYDSIRIIVNGLLHREKNWEEAFSKIRF